MSVRPKRTTKATAKPAAAAGPPAEVLAFIKDLRQRPTDGSLLYGMVRPAETDDGLMFAHQGDCSRWIHIPASAIVRIRASGRVGCHGHSHATAEIELNTPQSGLEKALASVAGMHRATLDALSTGVSPMAGDGHNCPDGFKWLPDEKGVYTCKPFP